MTMFCFQCEQTASGTGCTKRGVCGKHDTSATFQDAIVQIAKEIGFYNHELRKAGKKNIDADRLTLDLLFATVTNVNFDDERLYGLFRQAVAMAERLRKTAGDHAGETPAFQSNAILPKDALIASVDLHAANSAQGLIDLAANIKIPIRKEHLGEDILSLQELLTYGLKGTAAYAHHAMILGQEEDTLYGFFAEALAALAVGHATLNEWIKLVLDCGFHNFRAMQLLDAGNTLRFDHPEPTAVRITAVKGKAILVSGHDLLDLEELLRQTEGKGVNIYTHGEMLPAHGYPGLKKYKHLVGNYGGAWQDQKKEFAEFPGAILMTTNCIQDPTGYEKRIFTTGCVAWPGVNHIPDRVQGAAKDFGPVIESALAEPGFAETETERKILVGFARRAVLKGADQIVKAVKAGKIRHFFLVGGCDGAKSGRNYYTELAEKIPQDCVILTLACGKFRFNKLPFGDIDGIPRLLDVGQCNDSYSAISIAVGLADAFEVEVNDLPLSIILSWYEQKAVCVLLTLLALGIKNIKLGPSLPAFISPAVLKVLVEKFGIAPITTAEEDIKAVLG